MIDRKLSRLVGIITVIIIVLITGLLVRKIILLRKPQAQYKLIFDHATGLNRHDPVFLNGFRVGKVESVEIYEGKALVIITIDKETRIGKHSSIGIEFYGLTGTLKISIKNNLNETKFYPIGYEGLIEGMELEPFEVYTDKLEEFAENVYSFNNYLLDISTGISRIELDRLKGFTQTIKKLNEDLSGLEFKRKEFLFNVDDQVTSFGSQVISFNNTLMEVKENISSATPNSEDYRGFSLLTQSSIFNPDSELYSNVDSLKQNYTKVMLTAPKKELTWRFSTLYNEDDGYIQNFIINTDNSHKFNYRVGFFYNYFEDDYEVDLDLTVGKRYQNIILRGGIIESTPGLGLEFRLNKHVRLEGDLFNLSESSPFLHSEFTVIFLKNFHLVLAYQDRDTQMYYSGLGLTFRDDDLDRIFHLLDFLKQDE